MIYSFLINIMYNKQINGTDDLKFPIAFQILQTQQSYAKWILFDQQE